MTVEKRGERWCVVHGHPQKKGSKTDKPKGSVIKCFPGTPQGKEKAMAMHRAILISQAKQRGDSVEIDALFRDQIIAKAGVLFYVIEGKSIGMVKTWDDLKQNIGRYLPITVEHPDSDNGNNGLQDEETIVGFVGPLRQYEDKHFLIGDKYIDDDVDPLNGQSVGFSYIPVAENGELNGDLYDMIQTDLWLDHLALTTNPREPFALHTENPELILQLAAAAAGSDSSRPVKTTLRTIYGIGYDNLESFKENNDKIVKKSKKRVDSIMAENNVSETEAALREKLAKLEAEKAATDALNDSLKEKEKELKDKDAELVKAKQERDAARQENLERINQEVATMSDSIAKDYGLPAEFTKDQKADYIRGAFDALRKAKELWSSGTDAEKGKKADPPKSGSGKLPDRWWYPTYDAIYDDKRKKMVDPLGNPSGTTYNSKGEVIQLN